MSAHETVSSSSYYLVKPSHEIETRSGEETRITQDSARKAQSLYAILRGTTSSPEEDPHSHRQP